MDETKFFLASKRTAGVMLVLFGLVFPKIFAKLGEENTLMLISYGIEAAGALLHFVGQMTKKKKLRFKPKSKAKI